MLQYYYFFITIFIVQWFSFRYITISTFLKYLIILWQYFVKILICCENINSVWKYFVKKYFVKKYFVKKYFVKKYFVKKYFVKKYFVIIFCVASRWQLCGVAVRVCPQADRDAGRPPRPHRRAGQRGVAPRWQSGLHRGPGGVRRLGRQPNGRGGEALPVLPADPGLHTRPRRLLQRQGDGHYLMLCALNQGLCQQFFKLPVIF